MTGIFEKYDGTLTYESLTEMKYLGQVIDGEYLFEICAEVTEDKEKRNVQY